MKFIKTPLKKVFQIRSMISLHYFEFSKNFISKGESHDFWEFVYVDQGEVEVMADLNGFLLKQGEIIFHKPNEFHSLWANKIIAPNLIVISFDCRSKAMEFFENKIFTLGDSDRNLLAQIVKEGRSAFSSPLDDPDNNTLVKKADSNMCCEQLIEIYLELLLISITRKGILMDNQKRLSTSAKERSTEDVIARLLNYLQENIRENITLKQLCRFSSMGKTQLISLFKEKFGLGIIEYFKIQKIEYAKKLIREENYNLTEISEYLGYSSIHSFSRHFKSVMKANPSEYAKSAKARFD
jgi:AraC-like DNA-binding protein